LTSIGPMDLQDTRTPETDHNSDGDFGCRVGLRRGGRRNCSPCRRTIAAAGLSGMPTAALIDKGTLGSDAPDDILGSEYRRHR